MTEIDRGVPISAEERAVEGFDRQADAEGAGQDPICEWCLKPFPSAHKPYVRDDGTSGYWCYRAGKDQGLLHRRERQ